MSLDDQLRAIEKIRQQKLDYLAAEVQLAIQRCRQEKKAAIEAVGMQWCEPCNGTGAIERLDSGYMRRFGLQEWDGCQACGGSHESRGRGYVSK